MSLSSGWQRRKVSTRCLSTTWLRCLGQHYSGPLRRTARSPLTPHSPSVWETAGPWRSWPRSRSYCITSSLRPSLPQTVNDRASFSPQRYREQALVRRSYVALGMKEWKEDQTVAQSEPVLVRFFNWLIRLSSAPAADKDCLLWCLPPWNTRGRSWASEGHRELSYLMNLWKEYLCHLHISSLFFVGLKHLYQENRSNFWDSWICLPTNQTSMYIFFILFTISLHFGQSCYSISDFTSCWGKFKPFYIISVVPGRQKESLWTLMGVRDENPDLPPPLFVSGSQHL